MNSEMMNLMTLIETLRGENGCPWDKQQTDRSMVLYLIEEVYELVEAIESGNSDAVAEELGDVLFQVLFIVKLYEEKGHFDISQVSDLCIEKMIHRHPHVFGDKVINDAQEVKAQWHEIKSQEKKGDEKTSILDSVPIQLPALMRAYRISERAAGIGFDWNNITGAIEKVEEEWEEFLAELKDAAQGIDNQDQVAMEFGDVLFTLVNVARFAKIHPETALTGAIAKFEKRFRQMETILNQSGKEMPSASVEELNNLWELIKRKS